MASCQPPRCCRSGRAGQGHGARMIISIILMIRAGAAGGRTPRQRGTQMTVASAHWGLAAKSWATVRPYRRPIEEEAVAGTPGVGEAGTRRWWRRGVNALPGGRATAVASGVDRFPVLSVAGIYPMVCRIGGGGLPGRAAGGLPAGRRGPPRRRAPPGRNMPGLPAVCPRERANPMQRGVEAWSGEAGGASSWQ